MTSNFSLRGAVDLGALSDAKKAQAVASEALAGAPAGLVIDVTEADFQSLVLDKSQETVVIVDLWATWCGPCKQLSPLLEKLAVEYAGKFILAKVDVDANPQLSQMFQVQSIPSVFAILKGQAMPLFQGAIPEAQLRQVLEQVLKLAQEQGVNGTAGESEASEEPEVDPQLERAFEAMNEGKIDEAIVLFEELIEKNPQDEMLPSALKQAQFMKRLSSYDVKSVLKNAENLDDVEAQIAASDIELASQKMEESFKRLLDFIRTHAGDDKEIAKKHLLYLFEIVGDQEPLVPKTRRDLASALF
ncbi:MAG: tetratricopeptide repeat protein [Candidatus Nanopelagicales bacterium]